MTLSARRNSLILKQSFTRSISFHNFAASILREGHDRQSCRILEGFLLHFRNLIDFFGKKPGGDDLSISRPDKIWDDSARVAFAEKLDGLSQRGKILRNKYEGIDDSVSRYLHHCTEQRILSKEWEVKLMFDELSPLLREFESLLPDTRRPWGDPPPTRILRPEVKLRSELLCSQSINRTCQFTCRSQYALLPRPHHNLIQPVLSTLDPLRIMPFRRPDGCVT